MATGEKVAMAILSRNWRMRMTRIRTRHRGGEPGVESAGYIRYLTAWLVVFGSS
jgi:hypothetical protein